MNAELDHDSYSRLIKRDDTLLLVVDLQESMLELCENSLLVEKNNIALLDIANILNIPVIFTEHNPEKLGGVMKRFSTKMTDPVVLPKIEFSCLNNTVWRSTLRGMYGLCRWARSSGLRL